MQSEDRPIHFSTELIFEQREFSKAALQQLYFDLNQSTGIDYDNSKFGKMPLAQFFTKRGEKSQSMMVVMPDRIGILEDWVDIPLNEFITKVKIISAKMNSDFGIENYKAQAILMRTTFGLSHREDGLKYLFDDVCAQKGEIMPHFQRPISNGSLRFVLPATPEHDGTIHISIEPFKDSPREVYVEVRAVYAAQHTSISCDEDLENNILTTREFIIENLFPYLEQYDTAQPVQ